MFLNTQKERSSPTIEPLRIHKRESTDSPTPSSGSQHTAGTSGSGHYPIPSLPYPDDRQRLQQSTPTNASQAPYPYPDPRRGASPDQRRVGSPEQGRIGSPSYGSPKNSGSASSGTQPSSEFPASLRPHDGRDGRPGATLAERRRNVPKALPESPGPETPDKEGLFQKAPRRPSMASSSSVPGQSSMTGPQGTAPRPTGPEINPYPDYHQQYWPPPGGLSAEPGGAPGRLNVRDPTSVQRISSTASTSTTKATRGSPPPPETPIVPPNHRPGTDIEARYAAAGIAGASTLTNLQAQNAAAMQRTAIYPGTQPNSQTAGSPPRRPWTPTEQPGSHPHGQPTIYQGPGEAPQQPPLPDPSQGQPVGAGPALQQSGGTPPNPLESDFHRLHVSEEPPPAYSQTPGSQGGYGNEKGRPTGPTRPAGPGGLAAAVVANSAGTASSGSQASTQGHPAYANDPAPQQAIPHRQPSINGVTNPQQGPAPAVQAPPAANLAASPPPLPEGWIAHLDPNSGQYYYIHLPTQSTQWEFPKGPTPLNLNEAPLSPAASAYANPLASPGLSFANKPLASPGLPMTPGFEHATAMSLGGSISGQGGYTGPPPSSGVDLYKVVPTNGVYFGPYLRYMNMDLERELWLGSLLLVTDGPQPPTIHIHQSLDLSPNPRQLKALQISQHQRWMFYKYEVDLKMEDAPAKWTYAITSHLGCTRYEFLVAGRHDTNWRFVAHSGNDFGLNVSTNERARIGGVGYMWKDIMQKHAESGGFHCQLGLGSQIYADRLWKEIPSLKQWLATSGKENRKNAVWTAAHEEDVSHAYFHYYTSHFDQPHLREAFAQIPHVLTLDDHDM
jgi:PhoD related phosphatase/WW domain